MRIVSLIPSGTEIVCALGYQECLVGISHECDFPEEVKKLPYCTRPRIDIHGSSREIDERVKDNPYFSPQKRTNRSYSSLIRGK